MVDQTKLAWIRREISRHTTNEDEAWEFVLELLVTDWKEIAQKDYETRKKSCNGCYMPFLRRLMVQVGDNYYCATCEDAIKKGYHCKCYRCNKKFISYGYDYYKAPNTGSHGTGPISKMCPECEEENRISIQNKRDRQCIGCETSYQARAYDNPSLCADCKSTYGIDDRMIRIEYQKVNAHILRAEALNLPATLTLDEWFSRLIDAKFLCQYCLTSPYEHADHFIPLCKGGGTVLDNMVPACENCNKLKGQRHPDKVTSIPREALNRVRSYLEQFS